MNAFTAAGAGFLLAVLWFDLMFDVQTRSSDANPLPSEILASISAYYRRVTTHAYPMNRLVALVMLLTLAVIVAEIIRGDYAWRIGWGSLVLAGTGFVPTMMRTLPMRAVSERLLTRQKSRRGWRAPCATIICSASHA